MKNRIPDLVRAQLQVHVADTLLDLETVRDVLLRTPVSTTRSRALRGRREQLKAQLGAWEYLLTMAQSDHYSAYQDVNGE